MSESDYLEQQWQEAPYFAGAAPAKATAPAKAPAAAAKPGKTRKATPYENPFRNPKTAEERNKEIVWDQYHQILNRDPTPGEFSRDLNRMTGEGRTPGEMGLLIIGEHGRELASGKQDEKNQYLPGLSDPEERERFRQLTRELGGQADTEGRYTPGQYSGTLTPEQWRKLSTLQQLEEVPVSFLNPSLTVRREDVDTPEEATRFLQKHGGDTPLNRQLLKAAIEYGGLSIEPTPFGTLNRPGSGIRWKSKSDER